MRKGARAGGIFRVNDVISFGLMDSIHDETGAGIPGNVAAIGHVPGAGRKARGLPGLRIPVHPSMSGFPRRSPREGPCPGHDLPAPEPL